MFTIGDVLQHKEATFTMPPDLHGALMHARLYARCNLSKGDLAYAITYIDAIPLAFDEYGRKGIGVQLLYVLNNLGVWRGDEARAAKLVMKKYAKEWGKT